MKLLDNPLLERLVREQGPLLGIILLMFLIFGAQVLLGPEWYRGFMTVPGEVARSWRSLLDGNFAAGDFRIFASLLSSAFLHGNIEHILFNMVFLWIFAALAAELLGQRWMLTIFLVSAIAGSAFHTILNADEFIPMLGASGAVMGFKGAYLGMAIRWQLPDPHIWPISRPIPPFNLAALAVLGVTLDFIGLMDHDRVGIAYGAHIGGFLAGLFLTSFVVRRVRTERS